MRRGEPQRQGTIYNILGWRARVLRGNVLVQREGVVTVTGGAFTPFAPVFLGIEGLSVASYTNVAVPIGIALSSTTLYVKPGFPALQYLRGLPSDAEWLMPVTYQLLATKLLPLTELLASGGEGFVYLNAGNLSVLTPDEAKMVLGVTQPTFRISQRPCSRSCHRHIVLAPV